MTVLEELRSALAARADPTYLKGLQRVVPGVTAVGVRLPSLRALSSELHQRLKQQRDDELWALMDELCGSGCREELLVGAFLIARRRKSVAPWTHVARWVKAVDNWETCDQLATQVIAPRIAAEPARQRHLLEWAASPRCWLRRMAVATTVGLNQRGRSNPALTLQVCAPLLADPDSMVRKAVGWALRTACEHDPKQLFAFLRKNAGRAHPTVLREGSQKLSAGQRGLLLA